MKFIRFGEPGAEKPGVIDADGAIRDLWGLVADIDGATLSRGADLGLGSLDLSALPVVDPATRIGPCVGGVSKFVCIGLNYSDHAAETGAAVPPEPLVQQAAAAGGAAVAAPKGGPMAAARCAAERPDPVAPPKVTLRMVRPWAATGAAELAR